MRTIDQQGRGGEWSPPQSFVYRWPEYSKVHPPQLQPIASPTPAAPVAKSPLWEVKSDERRLESTPNLAWQGEIFGTGGRMFSPSRAVDSQAFSWWMNGNDESNSQFILPADWCIIWPRPMTFQRVRVLWMEDLLPREYAFQISDNGRHWKDLQRSTSAELFTDLKLEKPIAVRYFRLHITRTSQSSGAVGVRELVITANR